MDSPNENGIQLWKERLIYPSLIAGLVGGSYGLVSKHRKVLGTAYVSANYATNFAIVAASYCGAREFVRNSRRTDPDDLLNSAIAGFGTGAILGRIQGGQPAAVRYSVIFAVVGTTVDYATLRLKPIIRSYREKSGDWFKLPEWSPIQVLDEEALKEKQAREKKLYERQNKRKSERRKKKAFAKAWETVCQAASGNPTLVIPAGKIFLLNPISFDGPCKASTVKVQIIGNIVAPTTVGAFDVFKRENWIIFSNINGLRVQGSGQIDGQGSSWWTACPILTPKCRRPTTMSFHGCNNLVVDGLNTINSQRNHISIGNCNKAIFSNLHLTAPQTSPNTDGIDISSSTNGGSGYAKNIRFNNITLIDSDHPIIIDQYYCPHSTCAPQPTDVRISDVDYDGVFGTSTRVSTIDLQCSKSLGCHNINLNNINITASTKLKEKTKLIANCTNAHGKSSHTSPAVTCLLPNAFYNIMDNSKRFGQIGYELM
ncbi:hypothetical protein ACFE04_029430 [Oxalis oulophora]